MPSKEYLDNRRITQNQFIYFLLCCYVNSKKGELFQKEQNFWKVYFKSQILVHEFWTMLDHVGAQYWAIPDNNEPPPMEDIGIPSFFFTILHWNPYLFRQFCIGIHTFFGNVLGIPDFCLPQVWEIQTLFWYDFWNFILFPAISSLEWEREGIEDIGIPDTFGHAYTLDFYTFSHLLTQEGIEDTGIPYNFVYDFGCY